jgi:hypothetical protein
VPDAGPAPAAPADQPWVGNDVVDLDDAALQGKSTHGRFLERVLDPEERAAVVESDDPHLALWTRWAAKEAAFKVVSKLRGAPPVFVHRAFGVRGGVVEYEELRLPFRVLRDGPVLHVVSTAGADPASATVRTARLGDPGAPWDGPLESLLARLTPREADAVHSRPSGAVRLGARATLASALGVPERRLEIVCAPGPVGRRPPMVLLDGAPAAADVSLSHHGDWIAWAVLVRRD